MIRTGDVIHNSITGETIRFVETAADTDGERVTVDVLVELRELVHQVLAAARQVAQAGTAAQIKAAQDVLRTARKSIYKLLAEDD